MSTVDDLGVPDWPVRIPSLAFDVLYAWPLGTSDDGRLTVPTTCPMTHGHRSGWDEHTLVTLARELGQWLREVEGEVPVEVVGISIVDARGRPHPVPFSHRLHFCGKDRHRSADWAVVLDKADHGVALIARPSRSCQTSADWYGLECALADAHGRYRALHPQMTWQDARDAVEAFDRLLGQWHLSTSPPTLVDSLRARREAPAARARTLAEVRRLEVETEQLRVVWGRSGRLSDRAAWLEAKEAASSARASVMEGTDARAH